MLVLSGSVCIRAKYCVSVDSIVIQFCRRNMHEHFTDKVLLH